MAYCVKADIQEQLPEADLIDLTDDIGTGVADDTVVSRAIADADAEIDAHCQGKYTLPLSPVPPKVRMLSVDIAIYNLFSRRSDEAPEVRKDRHKAALRFLGRVAEGKIQLGADTPAPETTGSSVEVSSQDRVFTRDNLKGF